MVARERVEGRDGLRGGFRASAPRSHGESGRNEFWTGSTRDCRA